MVFEGRITQTGKSSKPSSTLSSRAFDVAKTPDAATHIRIKNTGEFVPITADLVIMKKKDSDGNPKNELVHYTQINGEEEFVCIRAGKESVIDGTFYVQVVFMKKSEEKGKGSYYRCDDGIYIHKDEIQVPAYKKVPINNHSQLKGPVNDGQFYVQTEQVVLPNGKRVTLPNDRVRQYGDEWQYRNDDNEWIKCSFSKSVDTRKNIRYLLLDNSKIVNIQKLKTLPNGEFVLKNVEGEDVIVGKKTIELERPFIEGSTMEPTQSTLIPKNLIKQKPKIEQGLKLEFVWRVKNEYGLKRVDVNKNRTKVVYTYEDGHREIYALSNIKVNGLKPEDKLFRISKIDVADLDEDGVKIDIEDLNGDPVYIHTQKTPAIAQNVEFIGGKLNSCTINGREITNIRWQDGVDLSLPISYKIDGVLLTDIKWKDGEVDECVVHLVDEEGYNVAVPVKDFKNSEYKNLAITYKPSTKIEDIKVDGETISFKIGDYYFEKAELVEGDEYNKIGTCVLKHNGIEEKIDLRKDNRFRQLRIAVNIAIDEQRVVPLVQSQLLRKDNENGVYQLEADVVQTEELKETFDTKGKLQSGGVANVAELQSVNHAIKVQDQFKQQPFKTVIIDDKDPNKTHTISDYETTYEGSSNFAIDNKVIPNLMGKDKVSISKGELEIDSKKDDNFRDNAIVLGFALCSNPITLVFGVASLAVGATAGIVAPIARSIRTARLKNQNPEKFKKKIQDNEAALCKKNINELVATCGRELEACKAYYTQDEYEEHKKEILAKFQVKYYEQVAKLQILGGGAMNCNFDPMRKSKLIPSIHLEYLEYSRTRKIIESGKQDNPRLKFELDKQLKGKPGNARILKEVELLQMYGGRDSQIKAHKLKLKHFDIFLDEENKRLKNDKKHGIEPEDFRKKLDREFNAGRAVWGSMDDKLEAFQASIEYKRLSKKEQYVALDKKRKALQKESKERIIKSIEFNERLDKHGNPIAESYTRSCMSYFEHVVNAFESGNTSIKGSFDFDYYDKLDEEHKKKFVPGKISEAIARRVNTTNERKLGFDRNISDQYVQKTVDKHEVVAQKVEGLYNDSMRYVHTRNYEKLFRLGVSLEAEEKKFKKDCEEVIDRTYNTPYSELNEETNQEIQQSVESLQVQYEKQHRIVDRAKKVTRQQYEVSVRNYALEEFAKTHKREFGQFEEEFDEMLVKDARISDDSLNLYFFQTMCKDAGKVESYKKELETYKVKHHIEENIEAETFCEINNEEFLKFIEKRNAESKTGMLDPNSELARCYFYAHWKKENPLRVGNFKRYFSKKNLEKAKERIANNTLTKHEPKVIKSKGARKTAEASATQTSQPVVAQEELTA